MAQPLSRLRSPRALAALALLGAWSLFFSASLLTDEVPFERDVLLGSIPWRQFLAEWIGRGTLPHWYPYQQFGTPFVGSLVPAIFHPVTWATLWLSPAVGLKATILLAYLAAEWGAYRAARLVGASRPGAVVAAYALAFGGYALGMSNNPPYLVPLATMPWVFVAAWRMVERERLRDVAALAVVWALVLLGGDLQGFGESMLLLLAPLIIRGASRRRLVLLGAAAAVACCISAIELVPGYFVSGETFRAVWHNPDWLATGWALHPLRLPELFIPHYIPTQWRVPLGERLLTGRPGLWSWTIFAGGMTLWLGAAGLRLRTRASWILGGVTVLALWLALGHYGGLLQVVWKIFPPLSFFRYPEKYLGLAWVTGSLLAGLGFEVARSRGALWAGAACLGLSLLSLRFPLVTWVFDLKGLSLPTSDPVYVATTFNWRIGLFLTGIFLLLASLLVQFQSRWRSWALPALVFVELFSGNGSYFHAASRTAVEALPPWAETIRFTGPDGGPAPRVFPYSGDAAYAYAQASDERVLLVHAGLQPDDAGRAGLPAMGDLLPSEPERSWTLFTGTSALSKEQWGGAFNICFRVEDDSPVLSTGESVAGKLDGLHLMLVRMPCHERAFVAGAMPVTDAQEARERMRAGLPANTVVWEGGPALVATTGTVGWKHVEPDAMELEVTTSSPAALVVSDAWAEGWSAAVDGVTTPIWKTNLAVRGIALPTGTHRVTMRYRAPGFWLGAALSLLGCLLAIALAWGSRSFQLRQPRG